MKITDDSPAPYSRPRGGFNSPAIAREAAVIFLAGGHTAANLRRRADPQDMLFAEIADAMDAIAVPSAA